MSKPGLGRHRGAGSRPPDVIDDGIVLDEPDPAQRISLPDGEHLDFSEGGGFVVPAPREAEVRVPLSRRRQPEEYRSNFLSPEGMERGIADLSSRTRLFTESSVH
jgi:hypothetical protein